MNETPNPGVELAPGVYAGVGELCFHFARSGGPGGQNVNKVNTKAELRVRPEALRGLSERALPVFRS
jgi:ribosome-associated protein